jgi:DNA-binding response OmpR family regulator
MSADGRFSLHVRMAIDPAQLAEESLGDGRLVVNWSRATMSNGDARVSLSRTELRLLGGLLDGNGTTVSRARLIAHGWPKDKMRPADRENALSVYIWSLRRRLSVIGLGSGLQTVRGVGYRIVL